MDIRYKFSKKIEIEIIIFYLFHRRNNYFMMKYGGVSMGKGIVPIKFLKQIEKRKMFE